MVAGEPGRGNGEAEPKKKRSCLAGCATAALVGVCVFGVVGGCWVHGVNKETAELSARLDRLLAEANAALPEVAEEDNAAPLYLVAFPLHMRAKDSDINHHQLSRASPEAIAAYVSSNQVYIAELKRAMARPGCRFAPEVTRLTMAQYSPRARLRDAAFCLAAAAMHAARSGQPQEAVRYLTLALRAAADAGGNPTHTYAQWDAERSFITALEHLLNGDLNLDPADLERLLAPLDGHLNRRGKADDDLRFWKLRLLVISEAISVDRREVLKAGSVEESLPSIVANPSTRGLWRNLGGGVMEFHYIEKVYDEAIALSAKPYYECIDDIEKLERRSYENLPYYAVATRLMMPMCWPPRILPRPVHREAHSIARLHLARLALGCRLYRLGRGRYPEKLAQLSEALPERFGTLPTDPFSGKSFGYARTAKGCKLWSAGPDRKDDGGRTPPTKGPRKNWDIIFELAR